MNNAVSLFVTLGLFGTFLGLSLAVASLTELIGYSNTSEWLSVLDSVGGGLLDPAHDPAHDPLAPGGAREI